jgi:uncharacterized protein YeaO (DUF488 family)
LRIGTARRPPRGVPKSRFASDNWYDVWFPNLAPSAALVSRALRATTDKEMHQFFRAYRREMRTPENAHTIALLAALSHHTNFSVGCYCADASRCHRTELRALLLEHGAAVI